MTVYTIIAIILGFGLGVYSLRHATTFVVILFIVLPVLAYFLGPFIDFDPHYKMDSRKSTWGNIAGLFKEIPEQFRLGVILFFPAIVSGRVAAIIHEARRRASIMSRESLDRKKEKIQKSYGMESWHS